MKKNYETAEIQIFLFENPDIVVASGVEDVTSTTSDSDETEVL